MHLEYDRTTLTVNPKEPEPIISIAEQEINDTCRADLGPTVCRLEVMGANGKVGRFWLSVTMKRGRPQACLTAHKNTRDMNATAIADWADDRRRVTTAIVTH